MGGGSSSNKTSNGIDDPKTGVVESSLPEYAYPEPPTTSVDDIRPPVPWYQEEKNHDDFDWSVIEKGSDFVEEKTVYSDKANNSSVKTPLSVIRPSTVMTVPLTNRRLRTTSGRHISFVNHSRSRQAAVASRAGSRMSAGAISTRGVKLQESPVQSQIEFDTVDNHARKTKKEHCKTFTALVDYLKQPCRYHRLPELLTARALVVWLSSQRIKTAFLGKADLATPGGLIQCLAVGNISFAGAYTVLCREAGLQCVLIDGVTKLHGYEPGDEDPWEVTEDTWTAVYCDGCWQIVHPNYICQGISGTVGSFDDWIRREIENKGQSRTKAVKLLKSVINNFLNEDYFMPRPEVFIHTCYADDNRWQLLPPQDVVRSRNDFLALPYVFPAFFKLGFKFVSEPKCVLESKEGVCKLWIANDHYFARKLVLDFDLILVETECSDVDHVIDNLRRLVINSRHDKYFYIEVRFPFEGIFKLEITGGFHNSHILRLCQFRLVCTKRLYSLKYAPFEPEELMWGLGPSTEQAGLTLPSMPTGVIHFHPHRKTPLKPGVEDILVYSKKVVSFLVDPDVGKDTDYACTLIGYTSDDYEPEATPLDAKGNLKTLMELRKYEHRLKNAKKKSIDKKPKHVFDSECVDIERIIQGRQLNITVRVPKEGEFALVVFKKRFIYLKDGSKHHEDPMPVCCYLLRTINDPHKEDCTAILLRLYDGITHALRSIRNSINDSLLLTSVPQRLARSQLEAAMQGTNIAVIRNSMDKCLRLHIPDTDDEVVAARTKYEYLTFKKELNDAIHRRNIRVVTDSLRRVSTYRHQSALAYKIRRLFRLRAQLMRLLDLRSEIPSLVMAGRALAQMMEPPPEIHLTLAALCLLLEEPEKYVESWDYIVQQLTSSTVVPDDAPIFRKMALVAEMYPTRNTQRKICALLDEYELDRVRSVSTAAARLHLWVSKVMAVLQDSDFQLDNDQEHDIVPQTKPDRAISAIPDVEVT